MPRSDPTTGLAPALAARREAWIAEQKALSERVVVQPLDPLPRFVAGVDAAFTKDRETVLAAAVVYDREEERIIEIAHAQQSVEVPYIPGFLSFREGPAVLAAIGRLTHGYGCILFDGQGIAHPRRCGIATHLAVTLDVPGVGVAKSRLTGRHEEPGPKRGDEAPLMHRNEQIGLVLRTKDRVRPLFISVGHRVDLASARRLVLACDAGYRLPEPTRQADRDVARFKRELAERHG